MEIAARHAGESTICPNIPTARARVDHRRNSEDQIKRMQTKVWVPNAVIDKIRAEASNKYPFEAGGTFMGWWADASTAVITAVIGAGPQAGHGRFTFEPDEKWQLEKIAEHYETSARRETYLGDWHSHPDTESGYLSWTDRAVLRGIIATPEARTNSPIMTLLHGQPHEWQITSWVAKLRSRTFFRDKLVLDKLQHQLY